MMPPVDVPAIKSKYDAKGGLIALSTSAKKAASNTPLIPPPSNDKILNMNPLMGDAPHTLDIRPRHAISQ
jgi:hypothetical protein